MSNKTGYDLTKPTTAMYNVTMPISGKNSAKFETPTMPNQPSQSGVSASPQQSVSWQGQVVSQKPASSNSQKDSQKESK